MDIRIDTGPAMGHSCSSRHSVVCLWVDANYFLQFINHLCPGNDVKLICCLICVLGMTLNSSVVVQGMTIKLWPSLHFKACGWGWISRKPPAGKGGDSFLNWLGSHFWVCITLCMVRHGDSVTKPDYYYGAVIQKQYISLTYFREKKIIHNK